MVKRNIEHRILFFQVILPYVCVIVILVFEWIASNLYAKEIIENKILSVFKSNIEGNIKVIDTELEQIEEVVFSISQNKDYDNFFTSEALTYAEKKRYTKMLNKHFDGKNLIEGIFLYSKKSDDVITGTSFYDTLEEFFTYGYPVADKSIDEVVKSIRSSEWANGYSRHKLFVDVNPANDKISNKTINGVSYARNTPMEWPLDFRGVIGVWMNEKNLMQDFNSFIKEGNGAVYVLNGKNEIVMSSGNALDVYINNESQSVENYEKVKCGDQNYYAITCSSDKKQWKYVVYISEKYVLKDMVITNGILNGISILALLIAIYISFRFASKRSKSTEQIMDMLGVEKSNSYKNIRLNELETWKPYLKKLIDDKEKLKENEERFLESKRDKALRKLILDIHTEDTAELIAKEGDLEFLNKNFIVMMMKCRQIYNIDSVNNKNAFLNQILQEYITQDMYIHSVDSKNTMVVINHALDETKMRDLLKEQITRMNVEIFHRLNLKIIIGVSSVNSTLGELQNLCNEALEVVRYNELTNSCSVLFYKDLPSNNLIYNYPLDFENKFIQLIFNGKAQQALKLVEDIYRKNFLERTLSVDRIQELFAMMISSLNRVNRSFRKDDIIVCKVGDYTIQSFFDYVRNVVVLLCEDAELMSERTNQDLFASIIEYINENYHDSELSLLSIADKFGFKDVTSVSKGIKNYAKVNFSSYLEKIRIDNACRMILDGVKIKDIPEKVGYIADSTFRRAFKKCTGLSPTEYSKYGLNYKDEWKN